MRIILSLLFYLAMNASFGQNNIQIKGLVVDSVDKMSLPAITVKLTGKESSYAKVVTTDSLGAFSFIVLPEKAYSLLLSGMGYRSKVFQVNCSATDSMLVLDLGKISLAALETKLSDVVIMAVKPKVRQEIDRLVYDVQADKDNRSQNLLQFLSKVPLLSLDGDENVLLKGSGSYRIFINGRPSALFVSNPKEALRAMPASSVKQVEVITTPPAKYDAEGLAGIINIVLKKQLVDGYSASVGLEYKNTVGTGQNLTVSGKKGKFGVTGRAYLFQDLERHFQNGMQRNTFAPGRSLLDQTGDYAYKGSYFTQSVELSYDIDSLNLLTTALNFTNSHYDDRTQLLARTTDAQQQLIQNYRSLNNNPQRERELNLDVNYQKGFSSKKDRLLTFSYQYQHSLSNQDNQVYLSDKLNYPVSDYWQQNQSSSREQTIQADYVHPASGFTFEGGAKAILRSIYSDFKTGPIGPVNSGEGNYLQPDDNFNYRQSVYSLYQSWRFKLKALELKAGLRLEHTDVDGNFVTQQQKLHTGYTNLIPVLSLQRRIKQGTFNLGYTQRINRPGIAQLNPFVDRSNPAFATSGNPDLKAILKNNLELSYSRYGKANLNISTGYSFSNNTIQQVTTLTDSVAFTRFQNLGKDKAWSLNVSISYPFTSALSGSLNSALNYVWIKGVYNGNVYANNGMEGYAYANLNYDIKENWRVSLSATLIGSDIYLQGSSNGYINSSLRVSRDLMKKKFTIAAAFSNPFQKYRYVVAKTGAVDFYQERYTQHYYRSFGLSLNYNINSLKSAIRKNERSIDNDDKVDNK